MEFKDRIRALRLENGMTQSQLAATLGKSEGAVRAWEIDRAKPDIDVVKRLTVVFDCTSDYLLGLSDFRNTVEENEIAEYSKELEEVVSKIRNGSVLLKDLVYFLDLINKKGPEWLAPSFLSIAQHLLQPFMEIYELEDKFIETQTFDLAKFFDFALEISSAGVKAKNIINEITLNPLIGIQFRTKEYASFIDKARVEKYIDTFRKKED